MKVVTRGHFADMLLEMHERLNNLKIDTEEEIAQHRDFS